MKHSPGCNCCETKACVIATDDFADNLNDWTQVSGSWSISGGTAYSADDEAALIHDTAMQSVGLRRYVKVDVNNGANGDAYRIIIDYRASDYIYCEVVMGASNNTMRIVNTATGTLAERTDADAATSGTLVACWDGTTLSMGFGLNALHHTITLTDDQVGLGMGTASNSGTFDDFEFTHHRSDVSGCRICPAELTPTGCNICSGNTPKYFLIDITGILTTTSGSYAADDCPCECFDEFTQNPIIVEQDSGTPCLYNLTHTICKCHSAKLEMTKTVLDYTITVTLTHGDDTAVYSFTSLPPDDTTNCLLIDETLTFDESYSTTPGSNDANCTDYSNLTVQVRTPNVQIPAPDCSICGYKDGTLDPDTAISSINVTLSGFAPAAANPPHHPGICQNDSSNPACTCSDLDATYGLSNINDCTWSHTEEIECTSDTFYYCLQLIVSVSLAYDYDTFRHTMTLSIDNYIYKVSISPACDNNQTFNVCNPFSQCLTQVVRTSTDVDCSASPAGLTWSGSVAISTDCGTCDGTISYSVTTA